MLSQVPVPNISLLAAYQKKQAFTDCYATTVPIPVTLTQFIEAFYTTPLFKVERWLLAKVLNIPSSDQQALMLAQSNSVEFSAWQVESRTSNEIILTAWQTRSWLCVKQEENAAASTTLYFGSVVISTRPDGKFGLAFHMLGSFHRLYSKLLLFAAAKRLTNNMRKNAS